MPPPLNVEVQATRIKTRFPKARIEFYEAKAGKCLDALLILQPMPTYSASRVRLRYLVGLSPMVEVIDPVPIREREGVPTPHLNPDGTLCLFDPDLGEWHPGLMIADTTIPWAERWLFHYENWEMTGIWNGDVVPVVVSAPAEYPTRMEESA